MSVTPTMPRLMIAGISGGAGKTLVSMGLLLLLRRAGIAVRAFKKGPDYIDAAWLSWASGSPARNLDTYLMGPDGARSSFVQYGITEGINVIEANRGLFDGFDAQGTHSSAVLAETLAAPVLLVVNATKMTRSAAALVLGCQKLDPNLSIRGVILNNVNGRRHEQVLRASIESICAVPVVGAIPRAAVNPVPERHLGLMPPSEHSGMSQIKADLLQIVEGRIDVETILAIARSASPLAGAVEPSAPLPDGHGLKIGCLRDSAFSFYYPENLEQIEQSGAELVSISPLEAAQLPEDLNALYIGGGFPETHAQALAANQPMLRSIRTAAEAGMPIYAECGGLILLSRSLLWKGTRYEMAGVFPLDVEVFDSAQGHGYVELLVDKSNPFFKVGTTLRGHEFHYSQIVPLAEGGATACEVRRGTGCFDRRDALLVNNVWASYTHLHALATPEWGQGLIAAAAKFVAQPLR
jgi:cobyrinic acid a,c-diamide synthase